MIYEKEKNHFLFVFIARTHSLTFKYLKTEFTLLIFGSASQCWGMLIQPIIVHELHNQNSLICSVY